MEVGGPLIWSRTGNSYSYNLTVRENGFLQVWKQTGPNNRDLDHLISLHIPLGNEPMQIVGSAYLQQASNYGPSCTTTSRSGQMSPRCRAVRRSTRVAAKRYEPVTPTRSEVDTFNSLLTANMTMAGKHDISIHTTYKKMIST